MDHCWLCGYTERATVGDVGAASGLSVAVVNRRMKNIINRNKDCATRIMIKRTTKYMYDDDFIISGS